ncbi:hypothetical protein EVAR_24341_1 [Eumeta japonica]|uniref:Uncharacterized protein n=1 Tax=Eumeta variegata TaxID=151549 RepID=A0A4C1VMI3_EUMVA|nr:hypothetical protein EVAR_24341_1 [Eumeta japonica]
MDSPCARTHGMCPTLTDQKPPEALWRLPLARRLFRLHLSGQKALESANGAKVRKPFWVTTTAAAGQHAVALTQLMEKPFTRIKTREITKIAIGIWSAKTTGALPRRRNRVRARRADGRVAGACRRDGRPWLNCRRAAYTARHHTHSYTRGAQHYGTRLEGTMPRSNTLN